MNTQPLNPTESIADHQVKTLLVDDSPLMLKVVAEILKQAGNFDVIGSASNGHQALRYVGALSPELVVMDVHMPRLDGIQTTRYIKRSEHPPIVILVTSDVSPVTRAASELAGADGFIRKDFNLRRQLIDVLQKLYGRPEDEQSAACMDQSSPRPTFTGHTMTLNAPGRSSLSRTARKHSPESPSMPERFGTPNHF